MIGGKLARQLSPFAEPNQAKSAGQIRPGKVPLTIPTYGRSEGARVGVRGLVSSDPAAARSCSPAFRSSTDGRREGSRGLRGRSRGRRRRRGGGQKAIFCSAEPASDHGRRGVPRPLGSRRRG